ncbi:MAG: chemotaxis protein CheW, partial [Lysobacter sp.]|nr:chemotaxis protein CheW [Lysobacter sp.]
VFRLRGEWLGLPASIVDEVLEPRAIHSLPHRREGLVRGLVNVRGQLTVCVALESLLQIDAARADPERSSASAAGVLGRRLVVLSLQDQRLAFESDEVHGAHRYDPALVGEVPGTVALASAAFSTGVLAMENRSVGLLDDGLVLSAINRRLG